LSINIHKSSLIIADRTS